MKSDAKVVVELPWVHMVGREAEVERAADTAGRVCENGERRVITVSGGDGSGKTRFIDELCERFSERGLFPERVFRARAVPGDGAHALIARLLQRRFDIDETYAMHDQEALLRAHATEVLPEEKVEEVCYFLGSLFGVRSAGTPLTRAWSVDPFHAGVVQQSILANFVETDAKRAPICLIFEDLQHADYESLDLALFLAETLFSRVLIVFTGSSEFFAQRELWTAFGAPNHELFELPRLSCEEGDLLLNAILAGCEGGVPLDLYRVVDEHAHGNPKLIERSVRAFFECGVLVSGLSIGRCRYVPERLAEFQLTPDSDATSGSTLSSSEMRVLEYAAIAGEPLWFGALVALARCDAGEATGRHVEPELGHTLHSLERRGLLVECKNPTIPCEREFSFVRQTERECALARVGSERRRRYHRVVGQWLSELPEQRSNSAFDALAGRHFEAGGNDIRAAEAYLSAASLARTQYAPEQAAPLFESALKLLTDDDGEQRIQALHDQGDVLVALGRTSEALNAFEEMLRLARHSGKTAKAGAAHSRIGRVFRQTGRLEEAQKHLQRALEAFESVADERGVAGARDDLGRLAWMRGDLEVALREMRTAFELRKQLADPRSIALSLNNIGAVCLDRGQLSDAEQAFGAALQIRSRIDDRSGQIESLEAQAELCMRLTEYSKAVDLLTQAQRVAESVGDRARTLPVLALLGTAYACLGESKRALSIFLDARVLAVEVGDAMTHAEVERGLSGSYLAIGDLRAAGGAAETAYSLARNTRSKSLLMRALRTLGTVTVAGAWGESREGLAVDHFMRSIQLAKEVGDELELAKTYRAFCLFAHRFNNPEIRSQVIKLREMADDIFARYRSRSSARNSVTPEFSLLSELKALPSDPISGTMRVDRDAVDADGVQLAG
ncbi:MAG TPA: tetratricopeptide repeat protein [Polyangiaceae bacterium]|nr:tetratricopeptide repeat protein [Polyangiaceae bacterium]